MIYKNTTRRHETTFTQRCRLCSRLRQNFQPMFVTNLVYKNKKVVKKSSSDHLQGSLLSFVPSIMSLVHFYCSQCTKEVLCSISTHPLKVPVTIINLLMVASIRQKQTLVLLSECDCFSIVYLLYQIIDTDKQYYVHVSYMSV